jgi:hypothetical protein
MSLQGHLFLLLVQSDCGPGSSVGIATALRAGRSGDRIPVEARFSAPVQSGPGAHPASFTIDTGSFLGVKSGRSVTLTPHLFLVLWSWKSRAIPLLPLWVVRPVQSLSRATALLLIWVVRPVQSISRAKSLLPLWGVRPVESLSRAITLLPLWTVRSVQSQ